jgi:translocation and assembly module TamB
MFETWWEGKSFVRSDDGLPLSFDRLDPKDAPKARPADAPLHRNTMLGDGNVSDNQQQGHGDHHHGEHPAAAQGVLLLDSPDCDPFEEPGDVETSKAFDGLDLASPDSVSHWRTRWRRVAKVTLGIGLGGTALALGVSWGSRTYVQEHLIPQVEDTLSQRLNRQVELGQISYIWPWQVTLRNSSIENLANIRAIDLSVDVLHWLRTREVIVNAHLRQPTILVMETLDRGWADLQISGGDGDGGGIPVSRINLSIADGQLTAMPLSQDRHTFTGLQGQGQLDLERWGSQASQQGAGQNELTNLFQPDAQFRLAAQLQDQPVRLRGAFDLLETQLQLTGSAQRVDLGLVSSFLPNLPIEAVVGQGDVDFTVGWQPQTPIALNLTADVEASLLDIAGVPLPFGEVSGGFQLDLLAETLTLTGVDALYGQIPFVAEGSLRFGDGEQAGYGLEAEVTNLAVADLLQTFDLLLPAEPSGRLTGSVFLSGALDQPVLGGTVIGSGQVVLPGSQDPLLLSSYETGFVLRGSQLSFEQIVAQTAGGLVTGQGQVSLGPDPITRFDLRGQDLDPTLVTSLYGEAGIPLDVGRVDALATVEIANGAASLGADLTLREGEITGTGRIEMADGSTRLTRSLLFLSGEQGRVAATGVMAEGQINGILSPRELDLTAFGLEGEVSGDFNVQVPLSELNLGGLRAQGSVQFPQGVAGLSLPLSGRVDWDGTGIQIQSGSLAGLAEIQGRIPVDPGSFEIGSVDLRIWAEDVDLTQLPDLELPPALEAHGLLGVDARLQGTPQALRVEGDLDLTGLGARDLEFERLQGSLFWGVGEGGRVDLQGAGDRISLTVSPTLNVIDFQLRQGEITALGSRRGGVLKAEVRDVPMELLTGGAPGVTGRASGNVVVNLDEDLALADASIEGLRLGDLEARQVSVALELQDDQLRIPAATLQLFDSVYTLAGTVDLPTFDSEDPSEGIPQLNLNVSTVNGSLEDIVATFKWRTWEDVTSRGFRLPDLGPAEAILAQPQGDPTAPLTEQLRLYNQVVAALEAQLAQETDVLLPQPPSLRGRFEAQLDLVGSLDQLDVGFQLDGQNWTAEEFQLDTVAAAGTLDQAGLDIAWLDLVSGERSARLQGNLTGSQQTASLQLQQVPLAAFDRFWPESLDLAGELDAQVDLQGTIVDPRLEGRFDVTALQVNQVPFQQAGASLTYGNGELGLDSTLLADQEDPPIRIVGTIPFAPAFTVAAQQQYANGSSPQIDLNLEVPGEGLRLLNLLTDQVGWLSGESDLRLVVRGTLQEPTLQGSLTLAQGVMQVAALPDPITDITGVVSFDFDRLSVQSLTAFYGGGSLVLEGILPVNTRGAQALDTEGYIPLNLSLNDINLVLPSPTNGDRLNTQVNGSVLVGGLLLQPLLLGQVGVSDGILDIGGGQEEVPEDLLPQLEVAEVPSWMPRFEDLRLGIGPRVEVRRGQLFSFDTSGELRIFGTPFQPQLAGSLNLDGGRLNLPLANFRVDRSQTNRVTFDLDHGLDPMLDLNLSTRASEVSPPTGQLQGFGSQSIDITARVQGRASEISLTDPRPGIVALSSTPPRSEDEIFAILGSNVLGTLGTSAGVVGLAGQGLITNFEDFLTDNLGLDEIRIGPVPIVTGTGTQSLGLGLEVARDLGPNISVSAQQIFTSPVQPTRFGARYRINPNLLLRLSTDLNGTSAAALEFETRF